MLVQMSRPFASLPLLQEHTISDYELVFLSVPVLSILFDLFIIFRIPLIDGCATSILISLPRLTLQLGPNFSVHDRGLHMVLLQ